jgi:hypothetical protein
MPLNFPLTLRSPRHLENIACIASRLVSMIVKLDSPPPPVETKPFHLSFLDQNAVRVYTATMSVFPVSVVVISRPHAADRTLVPGPESSRIGHPSHYRWLSSNSTTLPIPRRHTQSCRQGVRKACPELPHHHYGR